jgi:hypothetical protein
MSASFRALAYACLLLLPATAAAITAGQLDDFQDGTTQGWGSGSLNPNPPVNVADGGPAGTGDAYLQVTSSGNFGAGGKLITFNQAQWTGNYTATGVTFIEADVANFGATALSMRVGFRGSGGDFSSINGLALPADGVWRHLHFPIQAGDLTTVGGTDLALTMSSVFELRILSSSAPSIHGDMIVGQFGVDNITCGPVPITIMQWRSVRTHGLAGPLAIVLNPAASGNGLAGPTTESRQGGVQTIEVDFNSPPTVGSGAVSVTGQTTVGGVLQGPVPYTPTTVGMISATTLQITFAPGLLPDQTCYSIDIAPAGVPGLAGDHDVSVRSLVGDTTSSGLVNLSDAVAAKARIGAVVGNNAQFDVDLSGAIALQDALAAKSSIGRMAICP